MMLPHPRPLARLFPALLLVLAALIGCAQNVAVLPAQPLPEGQILVFGRFEGVWENEPVKLGTFGHGNVKVSTRSTAVPKQDLVAQVRSDGMFYLRLPPGEYSYLLVSGDLAKGVFGYWRLGYPLPSFTVSKDAAAMYVGTLHANRVGPVDQLQLRDDYEATVAQLRKDFPQLQGRIDNAVSGQTRGQLLVAAD